MHRWLGVILLILGGSQVTAAEDIVIADFEGADYAGWQVDGEAFGRGPARGTLPNQMEVSGFQGHGLANSYLNGDGTEGTLTSPSFVIQRPFINFLVGGGSHEGRTCIELLVAGKVVRSTTGADSEVLDWMTWDVGDLQGKQAAIRIVDHAREGWGHVCVDQIIQSDQRRAPKIDTSVLYRETYRPQFHFTASRNWLNDPNGLVYYKGEYHLFFQYEPRGLRPQCMAWGQAISTDLVCWRQLDDAILPDESGCIWSGSAVVDWDNTAGFQKGNEKTLVAIYTAAGGMSPASKGQPFTQRIAYSNDRGRTLTKYSGNPVLGPISSENRDPKVVWHAGSKRWVMALFITGSKYQLYSSPDLKSWTYLHDVVYPPGCGECPDFFEMPVEGEAGQSRWVFTSANGQYLVGSFDGKHFTPETGPHRADWGKNYYAVQTFSDIPAIDGRRIQMAWMAVGNYPRMPFNQQMSFPCELRLRRVAEGLRLFRWPVREVEKLRLRKHEWTKVPIRPEDNVLSGLRGDLFDIQAEIDPGNASEVGLVIRGERIRYTPTDHKLTCLGQSAEVKPANGAIDLRVLVDRTSLEVFAQHGAVAMSFCFLPSPEDQSLALYASGGSATAPSLVVHELDSAWLQVPESKHAPITRP